MNPRELDEAVRALREEAPRRGAAEAARLRLGSPRRSGRLVYVVAGVAVVGVWASWPRSGAPTMALAQVIEKTMKAPRWHLTFTLDGNVVSEYWSEGRKNRHYARSKNGILGEGIRDGLRHYIAYPRRGTGPNSRDVAVLYSKAVQWGDDDPTPATYLSEGTVIERKEISTQEGPVIEYTYSTRSGTHRLQADQRTGLVRHVWMGRGRVDYDYPSSFPRSTFDVEQPRSRGFELHDLDKEVPSLTSVMRQGYGSRSGVTLRAALLDGAGNLWIFWTGYPPDGRYIHPVGIPGLDTGPAFGLKSFRDGTKDEIKKQKFIAGELLAAMGFNPSSKVGDILREVRVWSPQGPAVFHNVPITRIADVGVVANLKFDE